MEIQINFSGEHQLLCVRQQTASRMCYIKPNSSSLIRCRSSQHGEGMPPPKLLGMLMRGRAKDHRGLGLASTGICLFSLTDQSHLAMSFKLWMRWERARVQAEANVAVLGGISLATLRKSYSLSIIVQVKIKRLLEVYV